MKAQGGQAEWKRKAATPRQDWGVLALFVQAWLLSVPALAGEAWYVRQGTWQETLRASAENLRRGGLGAGSNSSLRPQARAAASLNPLWEQLLRDFPEAARPIGWVREDGLFGPSSPVRFYRYDDPCVSISGRWQYANAGSPDGFARRFDRAGETVTVDFVGSSIDFLHKEGRLERALILSKDAEQRYGLAAATLDGQPLAPAQDIARDAEGRSVIDTSRAARLALARGLPPGRHRLTVANLGRPSHPGGSTAIAVMGFYAGLADGAEAATPAWRYALATRGGPGWQQRAQELAARATDRAGEAAVEQLYFASREMEAVAARLRAFHDAPPPSPLVERERQTWIPAPRTAAYLEEVAALKRRTDAALRAAGEFRFDAAAPAAFAALMTDLRRTAGDLEACLAAQVRALPPILFFTGSPLASGAVPNYVWDGNPHDGKWGCSIRLHDPAHPEKPARILFEDPAAILFDLNLSYDARTVFFSMRRKGEVFWQIYEMSLDGQGLTQITRGDHFNVCPVPLPDGRLAFLSSRTRGSHTVCQSGPSMHVYVMNRDGSGARDLSANTLTDFGLTILRDGRLLFTRWEYVDSDLSYRQALWTEAQDGRQLALYFGNTITDPASFWQAREIPDREAVVCTLAPHHGTPYGPIALVTRRHGPEAPRDEGFRWITEEFPYVEDLSPFWAYRDPCPVSQNQFLVSYGGGGAGRFHLFLLDEMDNKTLVYDDPATSCFYPQPVQPRPVPQALAETLPSQVACFEVPAAPPGQLKPERVALGRYALADVFNGLGPAVARGRVKSIRIMEQLPKTVNTTWNRVYDQGPLMSGGTTYYAKRCWGYAPVEEDGSAFFEAPAGKELYFQACDAEGRELQRMTSGTQLMPGETLSCSGCHEHRDLAQPVRQAPLAMRRAPSPLRLPEWGNAGVIDYVRVIQPILDKHCVRCHRGAQPDGGLLLTGNSSRFFSMSYDHLVVRSQSAQLSTDLYLGLGKELPLVQFNNMFPGIYTAHQPLTTGSLVSRLPAYFDAKHSESKVSAAELRRVYEWIDAMAPYYTTYYSARLGSCGDRDKWASPTGPKLAEWYTKGFLPVYGRRCAGCHGGIRPGGMSERYEWGGKWSWIDLSEPESSPALSAHLARSAGGRGLTEKDFGTLLNARWTERSSWLIDRWSSLQEDYRVMAAALAAGRKVELFKDTQDPDYLALLQAIRQGRDALRQLPEADMPGFVNRSAHTAWGYQPLAP
jgi:hypothetical protein